MSPVPYVHRWVPPTDAEMEETRRQQQLSARLDAARVASEPARRKALAAGPVLRDLPAALDCSCACHPRPADPALHDGGASCVCQMTRAERAARLQDLFAAFRDDEHVDHVERERRRVEAAATRLGVHLDEVGGAAPFVVRGRVDGRGFYLRERHDRWRVVIAADGDPTEDPWSAPAAAATIVVAEGVSDELEDGDRFDQVRAVEVAVGAVRLFLLRRSCTHDRAARFCPACGVEMADAAAWRLRSDDVS